MSPTSLVSGGCLESYGKALRPRGGRFTDRGQILTDISPPPPPPKKGNLRGMFVRCRCCKPDGKVCWRRHLRFCRLKHPHSIAPKTRLLTRFLHNPLNNPHPAIVERVFCIL